MVSQFNPECAKQKTAADDNMLFFFGFYLSKKIRLDVSSESSAEQRIHLKRRLIFSEKR